MKANWINFCTGMIVGAFVMALVFTSLAHVRDEAVIKLYKEGKIECATVGDEFICRERSK